MAYMSWIGNCIGCGQMFSFNPERVPSIRMSRTGEGWKLDPNGHREPVCRNCVERGNAERRKRGMPEIPILPGAYEAEEVD